MQSQSHKNKVIITLRSLWAKEVPYDTKSVNAIKAFYCAISMLEKFKTPVTIEILTLLISIVPFWKQNIFKVSKDIVIRNGEMKHNLSVPYDYVWGDRFVAVSSWDFCHNKIRWKIPSNIYLSPKSDYWWNTQGLRWGGVLLRWIESRMLSVFLLFQSFSWDNKFLRDGDIVGTDGVFAFGPP